MRLAALRLLMPVILMLPLAAPAARGDSPAPGPVMIEVDGKDLGRTFEGIGMVDAGGSAKLLRDYPDAVSGDILDYLFKPFFGAGFTVLQTEIGCDADTAFGTLPSHKRSRQDSVQTRGVGFWIAKEAGARNPSLTFTAAPWGFPAWAAAPEADRSAYLLDYLRLMADNGSRIRELSLTEDYLSREWLSKSLRPLLIQNGFWDVRLTGLASRGSWSLAETVLRDKWLRRSLSGLSGRGVVSSTPEARRLDLPLYDDEVIGLHDRFPGLLEDARDLVRRYVEGRVTRVLLRPALDGVGSSLGSDGAGVLTANTPWSGHYTVLPSLWMVAQFSQFALPGWKYLDRACLHAEKDLWVLSLRDPKTPSYSVIFVNTGDTEIPVRLKVTGGLPAEALHSFRTDERMSFVEAGDLLPDGDTFLARVPPRAIWSLTNTYGQTKGEASSQIPPEAPLDLPYHDDFSVPATGSPRYFVDQAGAFENLYDSGQHVLLQVLSEVPQGSTSPAFRRSPYTVLGDPAWGDLTVEASVLLPDSSFAFVAGRCALDEPERDVPTTGYQALLKSDGTWILRKAVSGEVLDLATGVLPSFDPHAWHRLALRMRGPVLTALVDDAAVGEARDTDLVNGPVALGCSLSPVRFQNLQLRPEGDHPDWTLVEERDPRVAYQGSWETLEGDGRDTARACRRSAMRDAGASLEFEGPSLCLLGRLTPEGGRAEVTVDGLAPVTIDCRKDVERHRAPFFQTDGLGDGKHRVALRVLGKADGTPGEVILDAILVKEKAAALVEGTEGDSEAYQIPMDEEPTPTPTAPRASVGMTA